MAAPKRWNETLLHHLVNVPLAAIDKFFQQMITSNRPKDPFLSTVESIGDQVLVWTLSSHAGVYVMDIGLLIPAGLRIFCCYFFLCQPARVAC